jgi:hypothetical protein
VVFDISSSVAAGALATASVPMIEPAPGRSSTMKVGPATLQALGEEARVDAFGPPAANGR